MIDIRSWLPRAPQNDPSPSHHPKKSMTVHYQGTDVARDMSDAEAQLLIQSDAQYHINKDWGNGAHGGGLMYAIVIAPSGSVYQTRDLDAVLWHAGDPGANRDSTPVLVLCGPNTPPTMAQLRSLEQVLLGQTVYPHSYWSSTSCPGDELRQWLEYGGGDDMDYVTKEEFDAYKEDVRATLDAMKAIYNPMAAAYPKHQHDTTAPKPQL